MFYYYDRDRDGIEHCYKVLDARLDDDAVSRLLFITRGIGIEYPIEIVEEHNVYGYDSADAYLESHDDEDFADWIIALNKGIKEIGYPFAVVRNADASTKRLTFPYGIWFNSTPTTAAIKFCRIGTWKGRLTSTLPIDWV